HATGGRQAAPAHDAGDGRRTPGGDRLRNGGAARRGEQRGSPDRRGVQAGREPLERSHRAAGKAARPAAGAVRIIAGSWGGRIIAAPPGRDTRPTADRVREAWMSAVAPELPGASVLDLFAGSGALGLEALSRGAREATFVER